jgi:membrane-bound lytic murein transglycosylase D
MGSYLVKTEKTGKTHKVVEGETLWAIANKYDVSVDELRLWNELTKYDPIKIDQLLFVKEPKIKELKQRKTTTYVVKPGDTFYSIAEKFEMGVTELMDLNQRKNSILSVGEEIEVYRK